MVFTLGASLNCLGFEKSFLVAVHDIKTYIYFADLQLDVKGCRDVYASFDKYVEVERLEGDNKYHAEEHGLQVSYCLLFDGEPNVWNLGNHNLNMLRWFILSISKAHIGALLGGSW